MGSQMFWFQAQAKGAKAQVINWFLKLILENLRRWNSDKVVEYVRIMNNSLYIEVSNTIQYNRMSLYKRHMSDVQGKRAMHK